MRLGENPARFNKSEVKNFKHRIILPLFIPKEEAYYADSFKIFEYCINSLNKTKSNLTSITVISNGSCASVERKLQHFHEEGLMDELVLVKQNIGKYNSIQKVFFSCHEPFITISDADVLFKQNWEREILKVFMAFPKAGMVCPVPQIRTHKSFTHNILFDYLFSKKMKFEAVRDKKAMEDFQLSLGWDYVEEKELQQYLTIQNDNEKAVVGAGHFCATYKRGALQCMPSKPVELKLGGNYDHDFLDIPPLKVDSYRLSTIQNHAYHLGNNMEPWMEMEYNKLKRNEWSWNEFPSSRLSPKKTSYFLKNKVFKKLFYNSSFTKWYFRRKGMN